MVVDKFEPAGCDALSGTPIDRQTHDRTKESCGRSIFPQDGDLTLRFCCGQFCAFESEAKGGLRRPTKKELRRLLRSSLAQGVLCVWPSGNDV